MKKILIVDDHLLVRLGTKNILSKIINDFEYFEASNRDEALKMFKENIQFDLVILDINIPDYSCDHIIDLCKIKSPKSKIMILSMSSESLMARKYYKLGVDAYLSKSTNEKEVEMVFREVLNNRKYFSPSFIQIMANDNFGSRAAYSSPFELLSLRELEIMRHFFLGKNVQEVSQILSLHQSTVSTYKARIFEKTKVKSIIDLHNLYKSFEDI